MVAECPRRRGRAISTFGGNPISMAVAAATLEVMIQEDTPARSAARGEQLGTALQELATRHDWIGEARGMGLMWGLEIVDRPESKRPDPSRAVALLEAAKEEGLLIGTGGLQGHVIRIGPSMLIEEDELDAGITRLSRACALVESRGAR
ncbi:MAG TPA: aminotransferase class III-fold pyridoxal phosphate-dependent enzyme [Longimicrobiales bacterium]|nr:aminotransferase class III-fold pyridoxal phosphate-dependent enzyme [Longimicrobiales bacterium]